MPSDRRRRDEQGFSLAEVLIASTLTLMLLISGYEILNTSSGTAATISNRAHNSTEARLAIDAVEASLRLAKGVWICAPVTTSPLATSTATTSCPTYTSGPAALLVSNDASPACAEWTFGTAGLSEVSLGAAVNGTFAVTPVTNMPGVTPATFNGVQTAGFTLANPSGVTGASTAIPAVAVPDRLVVMDLSVYQELNHPYRSSDAVSVQDEIAPDNLLTNDDTTSTPCT